MSESEHFAGVPRAALPAIIGIVAVGIVALIAASSHQHDHQIPVSP